MHRASCCFACAKKFQICHLTSRVQSNLRKITQKYQVAEYRSAITEKVLFLLTSLLHIPFKNNFTANNLTSPSNALAKDFGQSRLLPDSTGRRLFFLSSNALRSFRDRIDIHSLYLAKRGVVYEI